MGKTRRKTQPKTGEGRFTSADDETWPADEAGAMTPGPGRAHQEVFNGLFYQLLP